MTKKKKESRRGGKKQKKNKIALELISLLTYLSMLLGEGGTKPPMPKENKKERDYPVFFILRRHREGGNEPMRFEIDIHVLWRYVMQ